MDLELSNEINIPVGNVKLKATLTIPANAVGIIIFSHGSGSTRLSPRNVMVAHYLQEHKFATLLFDLLTENEDKHYHNRFDIDLLTKRLIGVTEWINNSNETEGLPVGYFGASTGAASALKAAAYLPYIKAIVSRGGRPDLAKDAINKVAAPTLLIVGSLDYDVLDLNKNVLSMLNCQKHLEVIEGATHLFEETGSMEMVSDIATKWFQKYLR